MLSRYDLVVLGDCNPDVLVTGDDVTPSFGQQEKLVDGISLVIGGSAAITAVAAARLGLRVALAIRRHGPPPRRSTRRGRLGSQERHETRKSSEFERAENTVWYRPPLEARYQ